MRDASVVKEASSVVKETSSVVKDASAVPRDADHVVHGSVLHHGVHGVRPITAHAPHVSECVAAPRLLAMGASTGGPRALADLFRALPPMLPFPILLVQHIGSAFVQNFVDWLQSLTSVQIRIAVDGEALVPNTLYVSPGSHHLAVQAPFHVRLDDGEPVHSCRPSVDVLFHSVEHVLGAQAVGVLLTGIGQDGAEGLRGMRAAGAVTIAQNEESAVVYGMPRRAIELNGASYTGDIDDIADAITRLFGMG
jgi:two-component system chemotaxis response regulator CheB